MTMDDYDSLPAPIRAWLSTATDDWQAATVLGYWKIWRGSVGAFVEMLDKELK